MQKLIMSATYQHNGVQKYLSGPTIESLQDQLEKDYVGATIVVYDQNGCDRGYLVGYTRIIWQEPD